MRRWAVVGVFLGLSSFTFVPRANARVAYEDRSPAGRVLLNVVAGIANVVPIVPAFWAKPCLPGYVICKGMLAAVSVVAAGEQVFFSSGGNLSQANAILNRGFGGDWFMTGRHINGDANPSPWPEAAAPGDAPTH
jgi:hypothetical protein